MTALPQLALRMWGGGETLEVVIASDARVPSEISKAARVLRWLPVEGGLFLITFFALVAAAKSEISFETDNRRDFRPEVESGV